MARKHSPEKKYCRETMPQNILQTKVLITFVLDYLLKDVHRVIMNSPERRIQCLLPEWRTGYCQCNKDNVSLQGKCLAGLLAVHCKTFGFPMLCVPLLKWVQLGCSALPPQALGARELEANIKLLLLALL